MFSLRKGKGKGKQRASDEETGPGDDDDGRSAWTTNSRLSSDLDCPFVKQLQEGKGATYAFTHSRITLEDTIDAQSRGIKSLLPFDYIGVYQCTASVGVYFEIGGKYFFCANIHAGGSMDKKGRLQEDFQVPFQEIQGEAIRKWIFDRLVHMARTQGWVKEHVLRSTIMIVGPLLDVGPPAAIKAGVLDFLSLTEQDAVDDPRMQITSVAHGFVVKPGQSMSRSILLYDNRKEGKKAFGNIEGYELCPDSTLTGNEWKYGSVSESSAGSKAIVHKET